MTIVIYILGAIAVYMAVWFALCVLGIFWMFISDDDRFLDYMIFKFWQIPVDLAKKFLNIGIGAMKPTDEE